MDESEEGKNATYSQVKDKLRTADKSFVDTMDSRDRAQKFDHLTEYDDD